MTAGTCGGRSAQKSPSTLILLTSVKSAASAVLMARPRSGGVSCTCGTLKMRMTCLSLSWSVKFRVCASFLKALLDGQSKMAYPATHASACGRHCSDRLPVLAWVSVVGFESVPLFLSNCQIYLSRLIHFTVQVLDFCACPPCKSMLCPMLITHIAMVMVLSVPSDRIEHHIAAAAKPCSGSCRAARPCPGRSS